MRKQQIEVRCALCQIRKRFAKGARMAIASASSIGRDVDRLSQFETLPAWADDALLRGWNGFTCATGRH